MATGALLNWGNTGNTANRSTMMMGQDDYINRAASRAREQYDRGLDSTKRQLLSMGVNPSSGAFMSMLNGAQYDRTASMNATGNDASYSWLTAAQNQFNSDRNYNLAQQQREDANNRYWNNFNWDQKKYRDFWDNRGNNAKEQLNGLQSGGGITGKVRNSLDQQYANLFATGLTPLEQSRMTPEQIKQVKAQKRLDEWFAPVDAYYDTMKGIANNYMDYGIGMGWY